MNSVQTRNKKWKSVMEKKEQKKNKTKQKKTGTEDGKKMAYSTHETGKTNFLNYYKRFTRF